MEKDFFNLNYKKSAMQINEQEKKIKKLNEEIDELKQRVEDSDR